MSFRPAWQVLRGAATRYGEHNGSQLAAGIAFYALFSIVPLTLFAVSVFGLVVRDSSRQEEIADNIVDALDIESSDFRFDLNDVAIQALYGPGATAELRGAIDQLTAAERADLAARLENGDSVTIGGRLFGVDDITAHSDNSVVETVRGVARVSGALTVVGLLLTAWTASALFASVRTGLNAIWDTGVKRPYVQQKVLDLTMVLGFGLLLGASVASTAAIVWLRNASNDALGPLSGDTGVFWAVPPLIVPALFSFLVFSMLYRYVPTVRTSLRTLWPGALLATLLFEVLKNGFGVYAAHFTNYDLAYGTLGGVLLFMLFTFLTSNILLFCGALTVEYGRMHYGAYQAVPPGPARTWQEHVLRFVRSLFVRDAGTEATTRR